MKTTLDQDNDDQNLIHNQDILVGVANSNTEGYILLPEKFEPHEMTKIQFLIMILGDATFEVNRVISNECKTINEMKNKVL